MQTPHLVAVCPVVLLGLVAIVIGSRSVAFCSRQAPEEYSSGDSDKAVSKAQVATSFKKHRKHESKLQVQRREVKFQVLTGDESEPTTVSDLLGSGSDANEFSSYADGRRGRVEGACCCYTARDVAMIHVHQQENETDPTKVLEYEPGSLTTNDKLTMQLGELGVDVIYKLRRQGAAEGDANGTEFHEIFVPLKDLPKSKCPRKSRVRLFVGEAESFEGRIDAENCVWKSYGCGHMRRRLKAEDDKCADEKTVFSNRFMDGFWVTQCEARNDAKDPHVNEMDMSKGRLESSGYTVKTYVPALLTLAALGHASLPNF